MRPDSSILSGKINNKTGRDRPIPIQPITDRRKDEKPFPYFFLLLAGLVLVRLVSILTYSEAASFDEELYRGTIGLELIEGLKLPLWDYRPDPYSGGPLVVGALASVFFRMFGPTLFALKLVPLSFDIATFCAVYLLMRQAFDTRTARIGCILIIFAPSIYAQLSLVAMGFHTESVCFNLWMLYFLNTYRQDRGTLWRLIAFSTIAGLSISFTMISVIAVAAALIYWFIVDYRSISLREVSWVACFLLLGTAPAFLYDLAHQGATLDFITTALQSGGDLHALSLPSLLKKLAVLGIALAGLFSLDSANPYIRAASGGLYVLTAGIAILIYLAKNRHSLIRRHEDEFVWYCITYLLLFALAYLTIKGFAFQVGELWSGYFVYFRYYYPLASVFLLLAAVAIAKLKKPVYVLAPLVSLCLAGNILVWNHKPTIDVLNSVGYSYYELGRYRAQSRIGKADRIDEFLDFLNRYPIARQRYIAAGFVYQGFFDNGFQEDPDFLSKGIDALSRFPGEYRPWLYELWSEWYVSGRDDLNFSELPGELVKLSDKELESFVKGFTARWSLGRHQHSFLPGPATKWLSALKPERDRWIVFQRGKDLRHSEITETLETPRDLDDSQRKWYWRGFGYEMSYYGFSTFKAGFSNVLDRGWKNLRPEDYQNIYWGIGWQLREQYAEDRVRAIGNLRALPNDGFAAALVGARDCEAFYSLY